MGLIKWVKDKWNKFKNTKFGKGLVKVVKGVGKGIGKVWKTGLGIANTVNKSPLGGVLNGLTKGAFGAGVGVANTIDNTIGTIGNIGGQVGQHIKGFVKGAEELTRPGTDKTATLHQMVDSGKEIINKGREGMNAFKMIGGKAGLSPKYRTAVMPRPGLAIAPKAPPPVRTLIP